MANKQKFLVEDPPIYTNFSVGCPYSSKRKILNPINAPVRCKNEKGGFPDHCAKCGWNPTEKRRRLVKLVGEEKADELMKQSEELSKQTALLIAEGKLEYV